MSNIQWSAVRLHHLKRSGWQQLFFEGTCSCGRILHEPVKPCGHHGQSVSCPECKNSEQLFRSRELIDVQFVLNWEARQDESQRFDVDECWRELWLTFDCFECGHEIRLVVTDINRERSPTPLACPCCGCRHEKPTSLINSALMDGAFDRGKKWQKCPRCGDVESHLVGDLPRCSRCWLELGR